MAVYTEVSDEELSRGKESVKGRLVLTSESTAARMTRISRATLFGLLIAIHKR